jgi:transposase-like protein
MGKRLVAAEPPKKRGKNPMGAQKGHMKGYSKERKEAIIAKMRGPHRKSIAEIAHEESISEPTLYNWRNQARREGVLLPDYDESPEGWSSRDKFNAVLESAAFSEAELSEYCRKKGLYPDQVRQWRSACEEANGWDRNENADLARKKRDDRQRIRELERELNRKEKALAETAALIELRKKVEAIWGDGDA